MEEDVNDWWTATDRETERERIEMLAETQRDKIGDEPQRQRGIASRGMSSWREIGAHLAKLQDSYDRTENPYDQEIWQQALFAIWPAILSESGIRSMKGSVKKRRAIRKKFEPFLFALSMMANRTGPAMLGFDYPIIEIRRRKKTQIFDHIYTSSQETARNQKDEVIGRAVLQEYRRYPARPDIDAAINAVSNSGTIDSIETKSEATVRARYHRYRKLAFQRGYADSRSFIAQIYGQPWPNDPVWLDDFPKID